MGRLGMVLDVLGDGAIFQGSEELKCLPAVTARGTIYTMS